MTVAYVGQLGTHLVVPHEANQPLPGVGPVASWAPANDRRPLASTLPNVGNIALTEGSARMSYNALQISGRRRLSGGLELTGFYMFEQEHHGEPGLLRLRLGQRGRRLLAGRLQPPRQPRAGLLRRHAQLHHRRPLQPALRQGPEVRQRLEQGGGPGTGRLERQLLPERPTPASRSPIFASTGEHRRADAARQRARQRLPSVCASQIRCRPLLRLGNGCQFLRRRRG